MPTSKTSLSFEDTIVVAQLEVANKFENGRCELVCFDGLFKLRNFNSIIDASFVRRNKLPTVNELCYGSSTLLQDSVGGVNFYGEFNCSVKHV